MNIDKEPVTQRSTANGTLLQVAVPVAVTAREGKHVK